MPALWKTLSISSGASDQPPLLISSTFTLNSYIIQITDLTRLWTESLDRKAILKRSFQEDTAIDPSEDAEQLRLFLSKIEGGVRGDEGTELALKYDSKASTADIPALKLHVRVDLPKPLPSLNWPIHLSLSDPSSFTEQVTIPLLAAQNARMKELEYLVETLKDKDHVIQKLVDKLEASGSDLGQIFPTAAVKGSKKITRAQAAARVKGLTPFDKIQWKKGLAKHEKNGDLKELAFDAFGSDYSLEISNDNNGSIPENWKTWWKKFEESSAGTRSTLNQIKVAATPPPVLASEKNREDEKKDDTADFQVQSTPPRNFQSLNYKKLSSTNADDSTEDEDLDVPSQTSAVPDSFPVHEASPPSAPEKSSSKGKKIGVIGKPKTTVSKSFSTTQVRENDDSTEDEVMNSPPPLPSPTKPTAVTPAKLKMSGLGKIGGRKRKVTSLQSPVQVVVDSDKEQEKEDTPASAQKKTRKLGVIGRKNPEIPAQIVGEEVRSRPSVVQQKEESPRRETSEERALRRREEIQKELSEKSAIKKPVKKKRKF